MASGGGVDGLGLASASAGALFLYAAVRGKSVLGSVQALIKGKAPASAPQANPITGSGGGTTGTGAGGSPGPGKGSYAEHEVAQLWVSNGGSPETADFAARVAMAESGGSATVTSGNPDGGTNVGIFQLDTPGGVGAGHTVAELQNASLNTQITIMATSNGVNWASWADPVVNALGPGHRYTPGQIA